MLTLHGTANANGPRISTSQHTPSDMNPKQRRATTLLACIRANFGVVREAAFSNDAC